MGKPGELTGKILYGSVFLVVLPVLLILWAKHTEPLINLPVLKITCPGFVLLALGGILVITGMAQLMVQGKGLPMNAFPPSKLVTSGVYSLTRHPIYTGAVLIALGVSVITKSSPGFWLVTPLFTLMIIAYVVGFENERTRAIFGGQEYKTLLSLPVHGNTMPLLKERIASYFLVYLPWVIVYEAFIFAGVPDDAISTNLPFEAQWKVMEPTVIFYSFGYLFSMMVPLIIKTRSQLREFIQDIWFALIIVGLFYLVIPFIFNQKSFVPQSIAGKLIMHGRMIDGITAALPSFHVIWALVAALYFSKNLKALTWLWYLLAILISASCITTGNHSVPDVIAGFFLFLLIVLRIRFWNLIRRLSEKLANSWKEWRIGPVRVINHGLWGGLAGLTGTMIACFFLGPDWALAGFIVMIFVIIGAGLWAQIIEGSPKLLRPYGYYGGLTGGLIATLIISWLFNINLWYMLGSFAMCGPWIQALGRLRCLVQGCCHGRPSDETIGIRFTHPLSRVNKISELRGVAVHPTQLYSIASNIISGLIIVRFYTLGMPAVFITGMYFMFNGLGRFVEESFRGEAQTPYWAGMRIYQWIAIINIVLGAFITTLHNTVTLSFQYNTASVFYAIIMGILVTIASGVDFPGSHRRFARLTS